MKPRSPPKRGSGVARKNGTALYLHPEVVRAVDEIAVQIEHETGMRPSRTEIANALVLRGGEAWKKNRHATFAP